MAITLFSWGYWGWGNATRELVKAFDRAEQGRGFGPPIFVDCRLRRQGRAKGFIGDAFKDIVGADRYRWMGELGNAAIATGGREMSIKEPAAASDLLRLALHASQENRRVIFFCACEYPRCNGEPACHRAMITDLLLGCANEIRQRVSVVEWPGGEPRRTRLEVNRELFAALMKAKRKGIPFPESRLSEFAALPWGSVATIQLEGSDTTGKFLVGPARFATSTKGASYWYLPVIEPPSVSSSEKSLLAAAAKWRTAQGLDERRDA